MACPGQWRAACSGEAGDGTGVKPLWGQEHGERAPAAGPVRVAVLGAGSTRLPCPTGLQVLGPSLAVLGWVGRAAGGKEHQVLEGEGAGVGPHRASTRAEELGWKRWEVAAFLPAAIPREGIHNFLSRNGEEGRWEQPLV